jgi:uncharacterized protein with GYD domain
MPAYIVLTRFTERGMANIKESPARLDALKASMKDAGAEMKGFFLTMGQYDAVAVIEAPDDETVARIALSIGQKGNVRSETLRAFTEDEYRKLVASLP